MYTQLPSTNTKMEDICVHELRLFRTSTKINTEIHTTELFLSEAYFVEVLIKYLNHIISWY